jgi:ribonuclease J
MSTSHNRNRIRVVRKPDTPTTEKKPRSTTSTKSNSTNRNNSHRRSTSSKKPLATKSKSRKSASSRSRFRRPRRSDTKPGSAVTRRRGEKTMKSIPPLGDGNIRIIPICGVEWIGTNMTAVEYQDEIVVIDAGFGFSNPDTPGINYTIPDVSYLIENKDKIKALVITHGHMDHVGAIPYIIEKIGNPPIYTREFGAIFIQKRMEEFPHVPKLNIVTIDEDQDYIRLSDNLRVKFFGLTHSIPDSTGVIIQTPHGGIVSTGDVRVENHDGVVVQEEIDQYKFFRDENILALLMDSTGVIKPGWSLSEEIVKDNIDEIIKSATGRLFIAAFSSQVERMLAFMESAKKHGKYIAIEGRSMKNNLAIAKQLNLTDFSHVIPSKEINDYPPHKIVVLMTGAQGEEFSALNRMANETHKDLKLVDTDTVVLSASVVPGNDYPVSKLKDNLYRGSYNVITYQDNQVHASGHGKRDELAWIHSQIPYKYFIPVHGEHNMLKTHATLAKGMGVAPEHIVVPDNGSIIEIRDSGNSITMLEEKAPAELVVVDGKMVGPVPDVVMRDRKHLGEQGIFVVVVSINLKTGKLKKSPDLISRGFIYLRDNQQLLQKARGMIRRAVEKSTVGKNVDFDEVKGIVTNTAERFLFQETGKEPIVIPVVLGL